MAKKKIADKWTNCKPRFLDDKNFLKEIIETLRKILVPERTIIPS